jgi:hypothetical protein
MIGWIVFFCIVALIALLLFFSVTVHIWYHNGNYRILVRYFVFTLYRDPQKKQAKKQPKPKKEIKKEKTEDKKSVTETLKETFTKTEPNETGYTKTPVKKKTKINWEEMFRLVETVSPPIKRLFSKIRVTGVYVNITVGSEDAATTAMLYGGHQYLVHKALGILNSFFKLSTKKVSINADFSGESCKYHLRGTIRLRLGTAIACGIWLLFRYLRKDQTKTQKIPQTGRNAHV